RDHAGKRYIAIRPERFRSPMKSRIWNVSGSTTNFEWKYNSNTNVGQTISGWWDEYVKGGFTKLAVPK
ncbi:MAG TPA: hypothetical protein VIJ87_20995, partial [Pyrinomonadaceae bacterium]